ncbi:MAG: endolytic transglycosylase MltG, partial [Rhodospirillales bacterium]
MRRLIYLILGFCFVVGVGSAGTGFWVYGGFTRPGPLQHDTILIVPPSTGINIIAKELASRGIISKAFIFRVGVKFFSEQEVMKAGQYLFTAHLSSRDVVKLLQTGKTVVHRITFAEGLTSTEIAAQLALTEGLTGDLSLPIAEGSLLPETYHFSYADPRSGLIKRMRKGLSKLMMGLWPYRDANLPFKSQREALILASIVEKETGKPSERAHIAGVFINRLRKKMRLQSDPTVVYGITKGQGPLGRSLRRSELRQKTAYNTYTNYGLPPTPIANAGRKSIEAVLHPMKTNDFYFVADGTGGHLFSRTLKQHNRNVLKWRKIEKLR